MPELIWTAMGCAKQHWLVQMAMGLRDFFKRKIIHMEVNSWVLL